MPLIKDKPGGRPENQDLSIIRQLLLACANVSIHHCPQETQALHMITILYFARFREKLGLDRETMALPGNDAASVQTVLDQLTGRGGLWAELLGGDRGVLVAVNQEMANRDSRIRDGDEVAIFPPVTGG